MYKQAVKNLNKYKKRRESAKDRKYNEMEIDYFLDRISYFEGKVDGIQATIGIFTKKK